MSALLLTVVILGLCVAAVVADLVGGPEQPATESPRHHRDYGGPWRNWLHGLEGLALRTARRVRRGLEAVGEAIEKAFRSAVDATQSAIATLRDGRQGLSARRRALSERHAAHARHIAHLEQVTQPVEPYPLPPPLPELEEHERKLREEQVTAAVATAEAVPLPPPMPLVGGRPGTALRERPAHIAAPRVVLPAPPTRTRVKSALLLVMLMSALGIVVTGVVLGILFLAVRALSGV